MKRFILAHTGEPVNFGDVLKRVKREKHSFGTIETIEVMNVTENNIDDLISSGIITVVKDPKINYSSKKKYNNDTIGNIIESLALRYNKDVEEVVKWLNDTNKVCPKAVLDLLLQEISLYFYSRDEEGYRNAETYYSIRYRDGKVGKVQNIHNYIPLFKSAEDAEKARTILKKQLELMYGK